MSQIYVSEETLLSLVRQMVSMSEEIAKGPDPQMLALMLSRNLKRENHISPQSLADQDSL